MQVKFYTYNVNFSGKSSQLRKNYSKRLDENRLTEVNTANLQGLAERFSQEGLTYQQCLKAAKKHPYLLVQKPETLEFNIRETAKRFNKEGLTTAKYLKSAMSYPVLFSCSPETIEKNIRSAVKLFGSYGITTEEYLHSASYNPTIYITKAETIKKKIYTISKKLNIPTSDILETFLRQPTILSIYEKDFIKKYEILKYIEENKFLDKLAVRPNERDLTLSILRKKMTNSVEYFYTYLLRNKISLGLERGHKIPHEDILQGTLNFIKTNKNKIVKFDILDGKYAKDFIKFVKNLSKSTVGKNIFRINVLH